MTKGYTLRVDGNTIKLDGNIINNSSNSIYARINSSDNISAINYVDIKDNYGLLPHNECDNSWKRIYNTLSESTKEKTLQAQVKNLNHRMSECMTMMMEIMTKLNKIEKKINGEH